MQYLFSILVDHLKLYHIMKYSILLVSLFLISSCGSGTTESTSTDTEEQTKTESTETEVSETIPPLGDPCQIPADEIASIIGWEDYNNEKPNSMNGERLQGCDYSTKLSGGLSILFRRHDNSNPDGRYLERAFQSDLEKTAGDMTFQEVSDGFGEQTIFSFGMQGPNYMYNIRWRFGNHTEKSISLRSTVERNSEETLQQLKAIATKLKN